MSKELLSVGLDVGTTSTQLILSRLTAENQAPGFSVPRMQISSREILWKSPVYFTPLLGENRVDGEKIRELVEKEYRKCGISRDQVDTGAVIVTGETSRKENAGAVTQALAALAGDFVVATAGPDLESRLAARGAGAEELSAETGRTVLHMDIGGGTSNLALIRDGKIRETGCMNVGGRLIRFDEEGKITFVSSVLAGLTELKPGDRVTEEKLEPLARMLASALEMAAGKREKTGLAEALTTNHLITPEEGMLFSFSGGVADCIEKDIPWTAYGDLGPLLGRAIRCSRLTPRRLGAETIRATVIGAGCHSTQLSGSTVFCRGVSLPIRNLPVVRPGSGWDREDGPAAIALEGPADYSHVREMGKLLLEEVPEGPIYGVLEQDAARALGQVIALQTDRPCLCIDGLKLEPGEYLDVGEPVGPAFPVVIKTLILSQ